MAVSSPFTIRPLTAADAAAVRDLNRVHLHVGGSRAHPAALR